MKNPTLSIEEIMLLLFKNLKEDKEVNIRFWEYQLKIEVGKIWK